MSNVIIEIDFPLPGGMKVSPARRIEGWEGHGKDPLSPSRFIEGSRSNRWCWQAGRQRSPPGNTRHEYIGLCRTNIEIRDHRLRIWRGQIGRRNWGLLYDD